MKDIPEGYVLVKATPQTVAVVTNGEAFSKTLQFLWNPDERIKAGSMELTPPGEIPAFFGACISARHGSGSC